ncbi:PAS domain S-box protein [Cyanobacterium aponinum FACHB-4101]|uniref:PAS domain S-box protein n=1 Tax=Cyanobacterium aponinum TaxID=379064 RepID=UPI00168014C0|nr:PAS domain S-box protein [Cyanobacterium aponinum]MBD2393622.1 PAS domain S-box protein [Cyanobacterium aponinum FACHB-4101]
MSHSNAHPVLILDNSHYSLHSLRVILEENNITYLHFQTEQDIIHYLQEINYIPIIFTSFIESFFDLKNNLNSSNCFSKNKQIFIAFISNNQDNKELAFKLGAIEFLTEPLCREEILTKISYWQELSICKNIKLNPSIINGEIKEKEWDNKKEKDKREKRIITECEERFNSIIQLINGWFWEVNLEGIFTYVSPKIEEHLGLKPERLISKSVFEIIEESDRAEMQEIWDDLLKNPRFFHRVKRYYLLPIQQDIWLDSKGLPIFSQDGKLLGFRGIEDNITSTKQTEQEVKENKQKLELITETINDVFWMMNWHQKQTLYVSKAFEDIWQHSCEELYQNDSIWLKSIHPEDRPRVEKAFAEVVNKGIYHEEFRIIRPDGDIRWIEDKGYPINDTLTKELFIVGCARDISESKFAQLALEESEKLHRMILNNISDTVFLSDKQGNLTFICPNVHFIFKYSWEEVEAMKNVRDLLGENIYDLDTLEKQEEINNIEIVVKDKLNQEHYLLLNVKLFPQEKGVILYSARDITERRNIENEKQALQLRNETLVKTLGEIVYEHNVTNHEIIWDGAYTELLGYSQEEIGTSETFWLDRIHPDDLALVSHELSPNPITERFFSFEYRLQTKNNDYLWVLDRGIMEYDDEGNLKKVTGVVTNICDRKRVELAIRHIAKAVSFKSEETFFQSLVKYLAEVLQADVVFLSEIKPETSDSATTLVYYHQQEFKDNFTYQIKNTPCQEVVNQKNFNFCLYSDNIQREYPHSLLLQTIHAQTYMGMGLFDGNQKPIGCLVALSSKSIPNTSINREIFQIFASSASGELERRKARLQLEEFNQQLEAKVKQRTLELEEAKENAEEKAIALRYLNEIERLLSDISTSLFMVEAEKVDEYINDALTAIASFLKVEQISIFEFDQKNETFCLSHQSQSSLINQDLREWHISTRVISWLVNQLQTKWIVMINSAEDLPELAVNERILFEQLNLKSFIALPIEFSRRVVGFLTAISAKNHHEWNQGETNLLQLTGKLFSNAIARKKSETALKEAQEALSATNEILMEEVKEREKIYNKLQQSEIRYRTLFESSHDALSLIDAETGKYIDCNEASIRLHDCISRKEFIGKTPPDFSPQRQPNGELSNNLALKYIHQAANNGGSLFEWNLQKKDGTIFPCLVSLSAIPNQKNKMVLAISRDISEIKRVQEELEKAKEEADSANKAKSEFLASMSHEIRTPMNAILGFTHLALKEEFKEKQKSYLVKIQKACESLLLIINDILDFSKIEAGKLDLETDNFLLDNILTDVANLLHPKIQEKGLELVFDIDNHLDCSFLGDSLRLSQILTNLINNAIKFTEKGQIVITVRRQQITEDKITLYFCVEDTGVGIAKDKLSLLFKPFSQADNSITRKYGGTGLGLVISRRLIEMMGGKIWAESQENKGSKFHFTINLNKGNSNSNLIPRNLSHLTSNPILVVDDNSIIRQVITRFLESFSFAVKAVNSGLEAIKELEKGEKDYKLIIIDWQMPYLNGIETIQAIKANPNITNIPPILMITAHHISELEELKKKQELQHFLSKPITKSSLFNAILEVFNHKSYLEDSSCVMVNTYPSFQCFQNCHLLLVEDNEINQEIVVELLQEIDIDVANNGLEALEKVMTQNYDAILMDISMPEMDGLEATKRIRKLEGEYFQKLPIIAMTAHAMTGDKELSLKAGMNDHITKPINPNQLKETLMQWLPQNKIQSGETNQSSSTFKCNQNEDIHIPPLPEINIENALQRLVGNKELYLRLLKQFTSHNIGKKELIISAIAKNDYRKTREIVHSIKGTAGNIGAENLFNIAQELESALRQEDIEKIPSLAEKFYLSFDLVINSLKKLENKPLQSSTNIAKNQNIDYSQIKELLIEIIKVSEIDLMEAQNKLEKVEAMAQNSEISMKIKEIRTNFDNFDLEKMNKNINSLLNIFLTINR